MPAYILANIEVTNAADYEEYRRRAPPIIAAHGGRYLVRGGPVERLEGEGPLHRLVVLEFPDRARAKAFYDSTDYQAIVGIRQRTSRGTLCIVDGV